MLKDTPRGRGKDDSVCKKGQTIAMHQAEKTASGQWGQSILEVGMWPEKNVICEGA